MILLDTDTLSMLFQGHPKVVQNARQVDDEDIATTIITKIEILRARHEFVLKASDGDQVLRAQAWLRQSESSLSDIANVPFDEVASSHFDRLRKARKLKAIGRADLLIACIALAHGATLVTRNLRHFRQVPALRTVNWAD